MEMSKRTFTPTVRVENKDSRSTKIPKLSVNDSVYTLFERKSKGGVGGWIGSVFVYLYQRVFSKQIFYLSVCLPVCRRSSLHTYVRAGEEGSISFDGEKTWSSINHSKPSALYLNIITLHILQ